MIGDNAGVDTDDAALVTRVEAAELLGITGRALEGVIHRGELSVARPGVRRRPSLGRAEVEALAQRRRVEATRRKRSRSVAEARRRAREVIRAGMPPGEWVFTSEAARMLDLSTVWVRRLASEDRLPHIDRPEGYFFRADHLRLVANARRVRHADDPVTAIAATTST